MIKAFSESKSSDKGLRGFISYAFFAGPATFRVELVNPNDTSNPPVVATMEFTASGWRVTRAKFPLDIFAKKMDALGAETGIKSPNPPDASVMEKKDEAAAPQESEMTKKEALKQASDAPPRGYRVLGIGAIPVAKAKAAGKRAMLLRGYMWTS